MAARERVALKVVPGRSITAIGIRAAMVFQSFQRWNEARLSLPISQTKRVSGARRFSHFSVSTENRVPILPSISVIWMRGCCLMRRAQSIRVMMSGRMRVSFRGLPGVTSHQTASSPSRRMAIRLISRCASCGGLKEPPSRPIRKPRPWGGSEGAGTRIEAVRVAPVTA